MKKRIILVLLAVMLIFCLAACEDEEQSFTISFYDFDRNLVKEMEISNEVIELPEAREIKGYKFIGWFLEANNPKTILDASYFVNNPANGNLRAFAHYVEKAEFTFMPSSINGCSVTGIIGVMTDVVIPETAIIEVGGESKEYVVEGIYDRAFFGNNYIKTVVIPDTVKKIGDEAFKGCSNLKEIIVPPTVNSLKNSQGEYENVGEDIFGETVSLTTITAPTWIVEFADNKILTDVTLNAGKVINAGMFKGAKKLKTVTLCEELETIGTEAFSGASSLEKIYITEKVRAIAPDSFTYCSALTSIVVDPSNTVYKSSNSNCIVERSTDSLIVGCSKTVIYEGVKAIGEAAFVGCSKLETLYIPSTVTDIFEGAFYACTSLAKIEVSSSNNKYVSVNNCIIIPLHMSLIQGCKNSLVEEEMLINGEMKKITSISKHAFAGCTELTKIYIPSTVEKIEEGSFSGCSSLKDVVIANNEIILEDNVFYGCGKINNITVPMSLLNLFLEGWRSVLTKVHLTTGDSIDEYMFAGCDSLVAVHLPSTVTTIDNYAFSNCKKLSRVSVDYESSLSVIGYNAFDGCSTFKKIESLNKDGHAELSDAFTVPAGITEIGDYAFRGCAISKLVLTEAGELDRIGYKVFANCTKMTSLVIPLSIEEVDFDAFNGCSMLKEVKTPADFVRSLSLAKSNDRYPVIETLEITSGDVIDCYFIRDMKSLKKLVIGPEVGYVDNRAFEGCSYLSDIEVSEENKTYVSVDGCLIEIASNTLVLGSVNSVIPEMVERIASNAFASSAISQIIIPKNVQLVESYAFSAARSLKSITVEGGDTVIEEYAFDGCNGVVELKAPTHVIKHISKASLQKVEITEGEEIEAYAFKDCVTLKSVEVSPKVEKIGENAFAGCSSITSISAPASILIGFSGMKLDKLGISKVDIEISKDFIDNFKDIKILYLLESDEEYEIDADAFKSCVNIEEADIPAWALSKIPTANIKKLTINSGSKLGGNVSLPMLEEIVLGKSVTELDASIFAKSNKLSLITVDAENTKYTVESGCLLDGITAVLCANGAVLPENVTAIGDYAYAGRTEIGPVTLHEGIVSVGKYAFDGCTSLEITSFPSTLESIGAYAFRKCEKIVEVLLPDSVNYIGAYAFAYCTGVTKLSLPGNITEDSIIRSAFVGSGNISHAAIPAFAIDYIPVSNVERLEIIAGEELAADSIKVFDSLKELIIGSTLKTISAGVIHGDNNLVSIIVVDNESYKSINNCVISADGTLVLGCSASVIPDDGVLCIADYAFRNCHDLEKIEIPASVTKISPLAFVGCDAVEKITVAGGNSVYYSVNDCILEATENGVELVLGCKNSVIPSNVTSIGDYAFYGAGDLTEIIIPDSVTEIGAYAFSNTKLSQINLPASVKSIGESAFEGASLLTKVIIAENSDLEAVASHAFAGCTNLKIIVIPTSVVSLAEDAFENVERVTIYWGGTSAEWNDKDFSASAADVYYYSKNYASGTNEIYWHYDMNGDVDIWN